MGWCGRWVCERSQEGGEHLLGPAKGRDGARRGAKNTFLSAEDAEGAENFFGSRDGALRTSFCPRRTRRARRDSLGAAMGGSEHLFVRGGRGGQLFDPRMGTRSFSFVRGGLDRRVGYSYAAAGGEAGTGGSFYEFFHRYVRFVRSERFFRVGFGRIWAFVDGARAPGQVDEGAQADFSTACRRVWLSSSGRAGARRWAGSPGLGRGALSSALYINATAYSSASSVSSRRWRRART